MSIPSYVSSSNKGSPCLWAGLPRGEQWDGVWGARYASGVVCCAWKGELQDWAEKEAELPSRPQETQVVLPLRLLPVALLCCGGCGQPPCGGLLSAAAGDWILWTWSLSSDHTPCPRRWGSCGRRICLRQSFSPMTLRDFLQFYPYGIYNSQYTSPLIRQVFAFFRHIDDKRPFNVLIWFKCFLNYVGCVLPLATAYPFFFFNS